MATFTRSRVSAASGRLTCARRWNPHADHSAELREVLYASAGLALQKLRDANPGVSLTEEQVQDLTEVLQ